MEIEQKWNGVNILVNNAGISYRAVVEHMTEVDEKLQLDTNYLAPASLVRLVLPKMREEGRGKIINISSVSGMLAMPTMASYSASKHALDGFSEALWYEAKPLGIDVCLVQPGFIRSKSFHRVRHTVKSNPNALLIDEPYADYYSAMTPFIERLMNRSFATSESVAKLVVKVIRTENPPLWIPATIDAVIFYWLRRLVPRRWLMPLLFALLPGARKWAKQYTNRREPVAKKSA
jgi:short-subunit dehydrogenase